jgi:LacI family transcriptional regulator
MPHIQLLREHASVGEQWFGMDDPKALALAVEHLLQLGHRRIAYVGPTPDLPTGAARLKGYRDALAAAKCWDERLEMCGAPSAAGFGGDALQRLLALPRPPTALVIGAVLHTHSVLDECLARDVRVPEQLSIVGFGDEAGFRWWRGGLTTISLPVSEMATSCGLWFLHQLRQKAASMPRYRSISAPSLLMRGSTAAVPEAGARVAPRRSRPAASP